VVNHFCADTGSSPEHQPVMTKEREPTTKPEPVQKRRRAQRGLKRRAGGGAVRTADAEEWETTPCWPLSLHSESVTRQRAV
jgi:hypothetical protein